MTDKDDAHRQKLMHCDRAEVLTEGMYFVRIVDIGKYDTERDAFWCHVPGIPFPQMFRPQELQISLDGSDTKALEHNIVEKP